MIITEFLCHIYEFHGDIYHGNPKKFTHDTHCHPYKKHVTAGELYQRTIDRENEIKSLGYNLVVIWESDWNEKLKQINEK